MAYDFDCVIDRAGTNATKLQKYADSNILPFWIADMDFAVPDFILEPLRERLDHPIVGYTKKPDSLTLALQNWLAHHYGWQVPEEWIVWLPGVVPGLNMAVKMLSEHEELLIPMYHSVRLLERVRVDSVTASSSLRYGRVMRPDRRSKE